VGRRIEGISEADLGWAEKWSTASDADGGFRDDRTDASLTMRRCAEVDRLE
jgi:hypothetical protein